MTELHTEAKRELLARMLRERAARRPGNPGAPPANGGPVRTRAEPILRPVPRSCDLALSSGQERTWFLEQLQPESVSNMLVLLGVSGRVDHEALGRSIATVVERHEVLRTIYPMLDGRPVQRITPFRGWTLPVVDLRDRSGQAQQDELRRRGGALVRTPFDLAAGPVFRTELLRLADDEYLLTSAFHHIVSDGWSVEIYFEELTACYAAFATGAVPRLPDLTIQYADFAHWHREWLSSEVLETQRDYWVTRLGGPLPLLELATDHPRPAERTFAGRALHSTVDRALLAGLRELSRREGVTLFTTLLTAFETLLLRHTGQEDLLVGTFVAGRERPEIERLIGFFVNMLALRTDLSGDPTFREALRRSRDVVLGAQAHADFPFDKLIEELQPHRDLGHNPILRVFFNKLSISRELEIETAGVRVRLIPSFDVHAVADGLTLFASEGRDHVDLWFLYGTELFEADTIARMAGHFLTLLGGIVADPDQRLWHLPLVQEFEQARLGWLAAGPKRPKTAFAPFHRLFEQQAAIRPNAVALSSAGAELTYAELNERANRVAHRLRGLGVGPGVLVGIGVDRSFDMVAGLLGIQKAGGAYVPLDPAFPGDRLAFMLADSGAPVLVTSAALEGFTVPGGVRVVDLGSADALTEFPATNPGCDVGPEDPVYVMYTSGSTGRPKGVTVPHRALANFLSSMLREPGLAPSDVLAAVTTLSFDIAGLELYLPLLAGSRVELVSRSEATDGPALARRLAECGATVLQATPATWRLLVEAGWRGPAGFRAFSGGETLSRELADQLLDRVSEVWNLYGPTETTVWSTAGRVAAGTDMVDVGRPIANTQVYVMDRNGLPAPIGVPGEIWIGGQGVALGYHQQPELTAERFVPDRFSADPAARLYRTGDRGRWRADGRLEHQGRLDSQVKLRGFRIELGEIEAALSEHPAVREAVVVLREDVPGDSRLVAYVAAAEGQDTLVEALRLRMKARLPDYMVPGRFVVLDRLPITPNGKVDRRALPAPGADSRGDESRYTPLVGPTEEALGAIWREILGIPQVGRFDNFFDLGGHSLLAMRVIARLRDSLGLDVSVRRLFEMQTVADLAKHLDQAGRDTAEAVEAIPAADRELPLPLSSAQERLWFFDQLEPGSNAYNMPAVMHLRGRLDQAALEASLDEILRRHEALRTTFPAHDGQPVQRIHPPSSWPLPVIDLRGLTPESRGALALRHTAEEAARPFDLVQGPLIRARLVCLEDELHLFLVTFHHIVADGWSIDLFLRELSELYAAHTTGRTARLPALPVQYADFAAWQQAWLSGDTPATELEYWKKQLGGVPPALELPLDFPRPVAQTFTGAAAVRLLEGSLRDRLEGLSRAENATLFMTVLAAFDVVLARQSGQRDICVGVPVAGRGRTETERLIGVFVNTLVLRTRLDGEGSFRKLLGQVRETALAAYAHQQLPFERLVEELQPERDLSRTPLYQVMFNMIKHRGPDVIQLLGLTVEPAPLAPTAEVHSKFDLTLYATDESAGLRLAAVYNAQLFSAERMEGLVDELVQLLEVVAADGGRDPMTESLVTPAAARVLPDPTAPLERRWTEPVHERFSRHARVIPRHPAVVDAVATWTYGELEAESNRLAHYLMGKGIGRETPVAIYAHRGAGLAWAMLGILKAGAAFMVIDPAYPAERTLQCLRLARPHGWIHLAEAGPLPERITEYLAGVPALVTVHRAGASPEGSGPWRQCSAEAPAPTVGADDRAYLVFTSGSTGAPKGIEGTHGPLSHFFDWHARTAGLVADDRVSVLSGLAHDPLLRDVLGALWAGATICMPKSAEFGTPGYLARWMAEQGVTVAHLTPAVAALVIERGTCGPAQLPDLRHVFFGGDVLSAAIVEAIQRLAPAATIVNFYGASETPQAIAWQEAPATGRLPARIPVGRGIADVQLLVLTQAGGLAGIGERGEIHVRTPYLARGYLDDPGLTTARFVPNPFRSDPTDRMYRTGDLGRYRPDGTVEFAGRADEQVKIRGYRVEPGDVEAVLHGLPGVGQAAVVVQSEDGVESRLVGYAAPAGSPLAVRELRDGLRSRLPDYMIPAQLVILDRLPLTPNGKLDRGALPRPARAPAPERVAPRTALEQTIAHAWSEVLGHAGFGVHDNFFELGGHSLMATRVLARLESRLRWELPVRVLFESPTVAELAGRIESRERDGEPVTAVEREEISL